MDRETERELHKLLKERMEEMAGILAGIECPVGTEEENRCDKFNNDCRLCWLSYAKGD